jgi:hypothetical protein
MPKLGRLCATALFASASLMTAQAQGVASSFDTDADGWYVSDIQGNGNTAANWIGGVIQTDDQFGETAFHAPTKFNGDWSSLYGSTLSFDLTEVGRDGAADDYYTAIIASGSSVLYWYGGAPLPEFTTFVAQLSATDTRWRLGGSGFSPTSGVAPTAAEFQSILGNITRLQINAEFITGADNTRLDNVILGAVPEPQTWLMLGLGLGVLALTAKKRAQKR